MMYWKFQRANVEDILTLVGYVSKSGFNILYVMALMSLAHF
jgi:hypothetical protein